MRTKIQFPDQFPQLETNRLLLSSFDVADTANYLALRSDREFIKYLGTDPMDEPTARERVNQILEDFHEKRGISWKLCLKDSSELIGYIGFWRIDFRHYRAEVGFGIHSSYQNKGLMNEAIHAVIAYGFNQLGIHSIMADADPDNQGSIALLQKQGFQKEAHFRENYFFNGDFLDSAIYGLLKKDFHH